MFKDLIARIFAKNTGKAIVLILVLLGLVLGFTNKNIEEETLICQEHGFGSYDTKNGCGVVGQYSDNLIIVTGNTANSPIPSFDEKSSTYEFLRNSIAKNANVKVVSASSNLDAKSLSLANNKTYNAKAFVQSINAKIDSLNTQISQKPTADGATYFEAITKAGRDLASSQILDDEEKDSKNTIIVIGSGLSDGGVLNFAKDDLLSKNVEDIVSLMKNKKQLDQSLKGVKRVLWYGIGQTVAPQKELSDHEIIHLQNIYRTVLMEKGVEIVKFDNSMMPSVSIKDNDHKVKTTNPIPVIDIPVSELSFAGDDWHITNESMAKSALSEVFEYAKQSSGKIVVTGYMAPNVCVDRVNELDTTLAGKRANTVMEFLKKNGITNEIEAVNGGVFDREIDVCENGMFSEDKASYRRKVRIEFK